MQLGLRCKRLLRYKVCTGRGVISNGFHEHNLVIDLCATEDSLVRAAGKGLVLAYPLTILEGWTCMGEEA
jgi:hypothetical protein